MCEERDKMTVNNYLDKKVRDISQKPFVGWNMVNAASSLPWWVAYNNVKHGRDGNFREASLENVLNALMALNSMYAELNGSTLTLNH